VVQELQPELEAIRRVDVARAVLADLDTREEAQEYRTAN